MPREVEALAQAKVISGEGLGSLAGTNVAAMRHDKVIQLPRAA